MGSSTAATKSSGFEWSYDVFLSFRGEDTRANFTSHLDMALRQKGVNVFIDDKLERGEQISEALVKTIHEALISIVIFSQNYASSSWCLDELVEIIDCKKSKGHIVWPIFYKVDPSDIRKQTGSFEKAMAKHQTNSKAKTQIWREALTTAANLSGWDLGTRKEADLIQDLVKEVLSLLNRSCTPLHVAKYPVGIDSQLEYMKVQSHCLFEKRTQHEYESDIGVYMVGIYGLGGLGKTTLAKALYNKIFDQFEACSFVSNVREASKQFNGLVLLQETLLYEILKENLKVFNRDKGINIIKNRLRAKKVLIVLDDVDKLEQLEALVGGHDWFGKGSKIIVTTRNKHLLSSHGFDEMHSIRGLNEEKALELFSWHAFKESHPSSNYLDLSKRATSYCKDHPLALVVLGSFLCTRNQAEWSTILDRFENSLSKDIKDILQLSFDGLEDDVKDIFLDVSCLHVGEEFNYVKNMLNACLLNADFGIIVLMDLSLITVENYKVQMHDLVRQMGHNIVYGVSSEPGKRSRLWLVQDVWEVFVNNSGTDAVKAIKLELPKPTRLDVNPQAFRNLKNLRLLIVRNARFSSKMKYLPDSLRWIKWHGFAHKSLPSCFITKNLVGLDLQHSSIIKLGKKHKDCERLKSVDLSHSTLLEQISNMSFASNLEELHLRNCTNLRTIDKSVFSLDKLIVLNLDGCSNLKKLPTSNFMLASLQDLNLSHCKKLERIPDFSAASNLRNLYLEECTNLKVIHESIGSLDKLVALVLTGCTNLAKLPSYLRLKSLSYLGLSRCRKLENFPTIDENMKSLAFLDLDFTPIKELPSSIGYVTKLYRLSLNGCTNLISLPNTIYLLRSLTELKLGGCSRFEMVSHKWDPITQPVCSSSKTMEIASCSSEFPHLLFPEEIFRYQFTFLDLQSCNISNAEFLESLCNEAPFLSDIRLSENKFSSLPSCFQKLMSLWNLELKNCKFLQEIPNLPQSIQNLDASGCESLTRSPDNIVDIISKKQDLTLGEISREFLLTGIEIPEWFSYKTTANLMSASFRHYPDMERTLAACVSFKVNGSSSKRGTLISCNIFICNRLHCSFSRHFLPSKSEYVWLVTTSLAWGSMEVNDWNTVLVWFAVSEVHDEEVNVSIRCYGVHVTEELHGIQKDLKWPVVNYADFYQWEKLQNLDMEALLLKRLVQAFSSKFNCKAMLYAAIYDPETIDSNIQPMVFPLHVTYNGYTVICGMEGMGETAVGKSLRNKFNWINDYPWRDVLDNSTSFLQVEGRQPSCLFWSHFARRSISSNNYSIVLGGRRPRGLSYSPLRKRGDGERGTNIITRTISSKSYYIIFENFDDRENGSILEWFRAHRWCRYSHGGIFGRNGHMLTFIVVKISDCSGGIDRS